MEYLTLSKSSNSNLYVYSLIQLNNKEEEKASASFSGLVDTSKLKQTKIKGRTGYVRPTYGGPTGGVRDSENNVSEENTEPYPKSYGLEPKTQVIGKKSTSNRSRKSPLSSPLAALTSDVHFLTS
jgi:hypothetical protein